MSSFSHFWQIMLLPNCAKHGSYMNRFIYLPYLAMENPRTDVRHFWQLWETVSSFCRFWLVTGVPKVARNGNQTYLNCKHCRSRLGCGLGTRLDRDTNYKQSTSTRPCKDEDYIAHGERLKHFMKTVRVHVLEVISCLACRPHHASITA